MNKKDLYNVSKNETRLYAKYPHNCTPKRKRKAAFPSRVTLFTNDVLIPEVNSGRLLETGGCDLFHLFISRFTRTETNGKGVTAETEAGHIRIQSTGQDPRRARSRLIIRRAYLRCFVASAMRHARRDDRDTHRIYRDCDIGREKSRNKGHGTIESEVTGQVDRVNDNVSGRRAVFLSLAPPSSARPYAYPSFSRSFPPSLRRSHSFSPPPAPCRSTHGGQSVKTPD